MQTSEKGSIVLDAGRGVKMFHLPQVRRLGCCNGAAKQASQTEMNTLSFKYW